MSCLNYLILYLSVQSFYFLFSKSMFCVILSVYVLLVDSLGINNGISLQNRLTSSIMVVTIAEEKTEEHSIWCGI